MHQTSGSGCGEEIGGLINRSAARWSYGSAKVGLFLSLLRTVPCRVAGWGLTHARRRVNLAFTHAYETATHLSLPLLHWDSDAILAARAVAGHPRLRPA